MAVPSWNPYVLDEALNLSGAFDWVCQVSLVCMIMKGLTLPSSLYKEQFVLPHVPPLFSLCTCYFCRRAQWTFTGHVASSSPARSYKGLSLFLLLDNYRIQ